MLIRNPFEAERDRGRREQILGELRQALGALPPKTKDYLVLATE